MGFRPQGAMNEVPEWLSYLNFADTDWLALYVDPNPHTYSHDPINSVTFSC